VLLPRLTLAQGRTNVPGQGTTVRSGLIGLSVMNGRDFLAGDKVVL